MVPSLNMQYKNVVKLRIQKSLWLDNKESKTKAKGIKKWARLKKHYIQCPTNIILLKPYTLVKINSPCILRCGKELRINTCVLKWKWYGMWAITEVEKGKGTYLWKVGRHTKFKMLRCISYYFVSTLMSKSRAQGKVCDLIQIWESSEKTLGNEWGT